MKNVIFEKIKTSDVYLTDLDSESIVGILWNDDIKTSYLSFEGRYIEMDNLTKKASVTSKEIKDYIKSSVTIVNVYLFDSMKELYKWMSE